MFLHPSSITEVNLDTIPTLQFGQDEVLESEDAKQKRQVNLCRSLIGNFFVEKSQIIFCPLDGLDRIVKAAILGKTVNQVVLEGNVTLPIWSILDVQLS